jgi:hypothetical protein
MNNNIKVSIDNGILSLQICDIYFILEQEQIVHIMNNTTKKWLIDEKYSKYPYFNENNKKINLLHFLYDNKHQYEFKNNNFYDLKKDNVNILEIKNKFHEIIRNNYKIIDYNPGHFRQDKYFNPYWKCDNNIIMLCSENILFELTEEQFNKILEYEKIIDFKLTWTYLFHKNLRNIYTRYKTNKININNLVEDFNYDNIKYIENNNIIINLTNDKAKATFLITHNMKHCKKIEKKNKEIMDEMDEYVKNTYNLLKTYKGHIRNIGKDAYVEKNRMWKVFDEDTNKNILLMYCEPGNFVMLSKKSLQKIKEFEKNNSGKLTWYIHPNGYIQGSNNMYIHQVITGCYGNGKGTMDISVDHIDRNKLNNCFDNLKIATREEQETNTKSSDGERRKRSRSAKPLPEGITNDMMKKYVVYYHEKYGNNSFREFFKIEKNPKLDKPWISSKSNKISILEKLNAANAMVDSLTASE